MICTSEVAVSLTIDNDRNLESITKELREIAQVEIEKDQTIICIVGLLPKDRSGYAQKVFAALKEVPLRMVSYGGSSHNISLLVNGDVKKKALQALNEGLFNYG
jgi:aspartate kinase